MRVDIILIAGAAVGIVTLVYAIVRGAGSSSLRRMKPTPIRDAPEREHINIRGTVVANEPLRAPYTHPALTEPERRGRGARANLGGWSLQRLVWSLQRLVWPRLMID